MKAPLLIVLSMICGSHLVLSVQPEPEFTFRELFTEQRDHPYHYNANEIDGNFHVPLYKHIRHLVALEYNKFTAQAYKLYDRNRDWYDSNSNRGEFYNMWGKSPMSMASAHDINCIENLYDQTHSDQLKSELAAYKHFFTCQSVSTPYVNLLNGFIYQNIIHLLSEGNQDETTGKVVSEWYKKVILDYPGIIRPLRNEYVTRKPEQCAELTLAPDIQREASHLVFKLRHTPEDLSAADCNESVLNRPDNSPSIIIDKLICQYRCSKGDSAGDLFPSLPWSNLEANDLDCVANLFGQSHAGRFQSFTTGWKSILHRYDQFLSCQNSRIPYRKELLAAISKHLEEGLKTDSASTSWFKFFESKDERSRTKDLKQKKKKIRHLLSMIRKI